MTTKTLGQVLYEALPWRARPWAQLFKSEQKAYETEAQAVAEVVREQAVLEAAMQRNRADLLAEDIEALHLCLDRNGVPRVCSEEGAVYSMWGRVLRLMEATRERCAQACEQTYTEMDGIPYPCFDTPAECAAAIRSMKL